MFVADTDEIAWLIPVTAAGVADLKSGTLCQVRPWHSCPSNRRFRRLKYAVLQKPPPIPAAVGVEDGSKV